MVFFIYQLFLQVPINLRWVRRVRDVSVLEGKANSIDPQGYENVL